MSKTNIAWTDYNLNWFTWVRGHNGHPLNERAHVLAMRGIAELERAS